MDSFSYTKSMAADSTPWTSAQQDNKIPISKNTNNRRAAWDKGLIPVLSVARLGDWHGSTFTLDYPVQIFDGMRDVLVNAQFPIVPAQIGDSVNRKPFKDFVETANKLSDDGPVLQGSHHWPARVPPGGMGEQEGATAYDSLVAWAKRDYPSSGWDGKLVPYDLLLAMAKVLYRVRDGPSDDSGVFVVLTAHSGVPKDLDGWQDKALWSMVRDRVQLLLMTLDDQLTAKKCGDTVDKKLQLKRVEAKKTHGTGIVHTKTYCIDHDLLYIGSDNLYPSYNEEHGIWLEDQAAISSWGEGFWEKLWSDTEVVSKDEK
ncbi:putative PLD phosphodiesterase domain-containing protein [Seiridium unicorne]|uniref:PLD phosphodiesterase domain-containing protein n=1 Tax=Seiridium unicorne TaxID=138068 RepID=A0ABR2UE56_9PEZI